MNRKRLKITAVAGSIAVICLLMVLMFGQEWLGEDAGAPAVSEDGLSAVDISDGSVSEDENLKVVDLPIMQALSRNAAIGVTGYVDAENPCALAGIEADIDAVISRQNAIEEEISIYGYQNLGIAVVDNHLNVRKAPVDGDLVGKMSNGAACEILDVTDDGWAHIKSGSVEGYVSADYLLTGTAALAKAREVIDTVAVVNTTTLRVREEPNTEAPVITLIPEGEEMLVTGYADGWVQFELDDETAYVSLDYVCIEEKLATAVTMKELLYGNGISDTRVSLVEYAKQFVGNPYVWGGTSLTKGCDCSGFVLSIYKKYGVTLPPHAATQANYGTKVDDSTIRPGDLIFYSKGGRINHVGIYIGNGQVLHASSPKTGIKISSMYYRQPAKMVSLLP